LFTDILGWLCLVVGFFWLWKPHLLRTRTGKKLGRKFRWFFYGILILVAAHLVKFLGVILIFVLIKITLSLQTKAFDRFFKWWTQLPTPIFGCLALTSILSGIILIWFK
jgi:hypothetical protein